MIVVQLLGGLGNQMFQAAAGLALARGDFPDAVVAAALRPARRQVRRNVRGSGLA